MIEIIAVVAGLVGAIGGGFAAWRTAKKNTEKALEDRLAAISGGRLSTIEGLVAEALRGRRIKETEIHVLGAEDLWLELRRGGFVGAKGASLDDEHDVAVVDPTKVDEEYIRKLSVRYMLVYKEGSPYRGPLPAGASVSYANSMITLEARLLEVLRHRDARQ